MKKNAYVTPYSERVMIKNVCVLASLSVGEGGEAGEDFEAQSMCWDEPIETGDK